MPLLAGGRFVHAQHCSPTLSSDTGLSLSSLSVPVIDGILLLIVPPLLPVPIISFQLILSQGLPGTKKP